MQFNYQRKILFPILIFIFSLLLSGCDLFAPIKYSGYLEISFSHPDDGSRAITPEYTGPIKEIHINGRGPENAKFSKILDLEESNFSRLELVVGEWEISVDAYVAKEKKVAHGTQRVNIRAGKTSTVTIPLIPIDGCGSLELGCNWDISLSENAIMKVSVSSMDTSVIQVFDDSFNFLSSTSGVLSIDDLSDGNYLLQLKVVDQNTEYVTIFETFEIRDSTKTEDTISFSLSPRNEFSSFISTSLISHSTIKLKGIQSSFLYGETIELQIIEPENLNRIHWYLDGQLVVEFIDQEEFILSDQEPSFHQIICIATTVDSIVTTVYEYTVTKQEHTPLSDFSYEIEDEVVIITEYIGNDSTVIIPTQILDYPVRKIGDNAFKNNSSVEFVVLPDSITHIGFSAFKSCENLRQIEFSKNLQFIEDEAFLSCTVLRGVSFPESLESLGAMSFSMCHGIYSVYIPASVKSIGEGAFAYCKNLSTVDVSDANRCYISAHGSLLTIDGKTLLFYTSINNSTHGSLIPNTVETIAPYAFANRNYVNLNIPEGVREIGRKAFTGCIIESLILPESLERIGDEAFSSMALYSSDIKISGNVVSMGKRVFADPQRPYFHVYCRAASQPSGWDAEWTQGYPVTIVWGKIHTNDDLFSYDVDFETNTAIIKGYFGNSESIRVPQTISRNNYKVQAIAPNAFKDNTSIVEIFLPSGVSSIGSSAFQGCLNLERIWLPDTLERIEEYALSACTSLKSIHLPSNLEFIGTQAFSYTSLEFIYIPDGVEQMGGNVFWNSPNTLIAYCQPLERKSGWSVNWNKGIQEPVYGISPISEFNYATDNSSITIINLVGEASSSVVLAPEYTDPHTLENLRVKHIANDAFADQKVLSEVKLPDSIVSIGHSAFSGCTNLTSVRLPKNLEKIEARTFSNCQSLASIELPLSLSSIGDYAFANAVSLSQILLSDGLVEMGRNIFDSCTSLKHVYCKALERPVFWSSSWKNGWSSGEVHWNHYPNPPSDFVYTKYNNLNEIRIDGYIGSSDTVVIPFSIDGMDVTELNYQCFYNKKNIKQIVLPSTIHTIGSMSFAGTGISSFVIPNSVQTVTGRAWYECNSLSEFVVAQDHPTFSVVDGILYSKDGSELISYPPAKTGCSFSVPEYVDCIKSNAIIEPIHLQHMLVPPSLNEMEEYAVNSKTVKIYYEKQNQPEWAFLDYWLFEEIFDPSHLYFGVAVLPNEDFWEYETTPEDQIRLTRYIGTENRVCVPTIVDGKQVIAIDSQAFDTQSQLQELYILENITVFDFEHITTLPNLKKLFFSKQNENFFSHDGITYTSAQDTIHFVDRDYPMKDLNILHEVVHIGARAFANQTNLELVVLPDSVQSLGSSIFAGCDALADIYCEFENKPIGWSSDWDEGYGGTTHWIVTPLTELVYTITNGEVVITGSNGISENLIIPPYIDGYPVCMIESRAFKESPVKTLITPASMRIIGSEAFYGSALETVYITEGCMEFGWRCFSSCKNLKTVRLPESSEFPLKVLSSQMFYRCVSLTNINIPNTVQTIGSHAFFGCQELTTITIPDSVIRLEDQAFSNCTSLASLEIPDNVTSIGEELVLNCISLRDIKLPATITKLNYQTFYGCTSLQSIDLPSSLESISDRVFMGCSQLQDISLPGSLSNIGSQTFFGCVSLTSITIPASVRTFGAHAFNGCTSLISVRCEANSKPYGWATDWMDVEGVAVYWGVSSLSKSSSSLKESSAYHPDVTSTQIQTTITPKCCSKLSIASIGRGGILQKHEMYKGGTPFAWDQRGYTS
ncbi:leucine-rich repeat protein [uncultured Sphaerochaeta sp.]|uniref:leucine-rich repeat domain-containing protein n=1 Tax=uncultured Sphaerochaeta sp. TaxID=886478 RepID=UPI0029CA5958|nr:leucine-rich repeat protein [uncultured Sphaerochaeta sp.]